MQEFFRRADALRAQLKARREWEQRERALCWGAPLTVAPALAFMPVLIYCVVSPSFPHSRLLGLALFPLLLACELLGISRLARCLRHSFDILAVMAFSSILVLLVVVAYTGVFLAAFLFRN